MGWETRAGRRYFYKKVRRNGKVCSIYVGSEVAAGELIRRHEEQQELELKRLAAFKCRRTDIVKLNTTINSVAQTIELVMRAVLLSEGYHSPFGTHWRLRYAKTRR